MTDILEEKLEASRCVREEEYDKPSWAYFQADRNGYERALRELINLVKP